MTTRPQTARRASRSTPAVRLGGRRRSRLGAWRQVTPRRGGSRKRAPEWPAIRATACRRQTSRLGATNGRDPVRRPHRAALPDCQVACGGCGKASALTSNSHSFRQAQHRRPRRMRPGLPSTMPALNRTPGEPHCGHDGASAESMGWGPSGGLSIQYPRHARWLCTEARAKGCRVCLQPFSEAKPCSPDAPGE